MSLVFTKEWLNVANKALNLIGESPLQSLSGSSSNNESLNIQLPAAVEAVLSSYPFRCATRRTVLAPDADTVPAFGYAYSFPLPENFARLVRVENNKDFMLEGGSILSNDTPLAIVYVALPKDPHSLSHSVIEAISLTLAYKMAQTATANDSLLNRLRQDAALALVQAEKDDKAGHEQDSSMAWWGDAR
jgi:hypothetical protein